MDFGYTTNIFGFNKILNLFILRVCNVIMYKYNYLINEVLSEKERLEKITLYKNK